MKLQWPIRRDKRKATGLEEGVTAQELKTEAGLRGIQAEEDLANRIKFEDECNANIINHILDQLIILLKKDKPTEQDKELIQTMNAWLVSWEEYRATRKTAVAWSIAGDDYNMSKRYRAYETYFSRRWPEPWESKKIMRFSAYMRDISYRERHVEPAPRIVVWGMPSGMGSRIDLARVMEASKRMEEGEGGETEK